MDAVSYTHLILTLPLSRDGNAIIYGSAGSGKEQMLNAIIYISDDIFCKIVAVIRIAVPYTGMIISTRAVSYTHLDVYKRQAQSYRQTIFFTKLLYECIHISTRLITTKVKNHLRTH